ncbi:hypothetical protein FVEG_08720 [Fusarium verticillioides 7600]|uniref:Uncharacterized protein n=1 Tax=Gibberella moniliformis (strain M3125 / FGSC 7600) TaxID=334819 RepID=W7MC81_GIBM7|nr:hypothetical protein FVEG_08720 [Fusarium verticillioides 7600]EWG49108.1 hypothetical protein FVEG_08720 [Fusarium verticillioides 7600]
MVTEGVVNNLYPLQMTMTQAKTGRYRSERPGSLESPSLYSLRDLREPALLRLMSVQASVSVILKAGDEASDEAGKRARDFNFAIDRIIIEFPSFQDIDYGQTY